MFETWDPFEPPDDLDVALKTINWHSVAPATLKRMPIPETLVMALTVATTVATGNLALGVAAGVLLAMVLFARRVAQAAFHGQSWSLAQFDAQFRN